MVKFRWYFNKDKEVKWLNQMSAKGYALADFFCGVYILKKSEPGEYIYQIDITEGFFRVDDDYREFMKETGVEIVCLWGPWVILRKKAAEGAFELYTDVQSLIEHYTRIKMLFRMVIIFEIVCLIMELLSAMNGKTGNGAMGAAMLIVAFLAVMIRELMRVKQILAELKARIGEDVGMFRWGNRKLSGFICLGCLLNSIWWIAKDYLPDVFLEGFWHGVIVGLICFLLFIGIIRTAWGSKD